MTRAAPERKQAFRGGSLCFCGRGRLVLKKVLRRWRSAFETADQAFLAISISWVKAAASLTASSASILRLISMPATFRPCMKEE